jgi:hypothetical protein
LFNVENVAPARFLLTVGKELMDELHRRRSFADRDANQPPQ